MACQTLGPRDLKLGMHIPLDPGSDLVNIPTPGVGGGGELMTVIFLLLGQ